MSSRTLGPNETLPLPAARYAVAISWDHDGRPIDVDLQACVVDNRGTIIDAVYYNNMKALRCMTHSGDEQTGEREGFDEVIWVGLSKLPENVKMIIYVVAAHTGGYLRDVKNGMIHLLEETQQNEVGCVRMEKSAKQVDVVATMVRSTSGSWDFHVVDEPAQEGQHFMDILEPTMGNLIRKVIPGAPRRQKVAFAMDKGTVLDLPQSDALRMVTAGLGWDVLGKGVDLDVSAVLLDGQHKLVDVVFFGKLKGSGLSHSGDNLTGEGEGDDEQIQCDLAAVPQKVQQMFICVHVYTRNVTFQQVQNAHCRIFDSSNNELARYELKRCGRGTGLIMARFLREGSGSRWGFQALGTFSNGSMWKDSLQDIQAVSRQSPQALQLRSQTTMEFSTGVRDMPAPALDGRADKQGECCTLQ